MESFIQDEEINFDILSNRFLKLILEILIEMNLPLESTPQNKSEEDGNSIEKFNTPIPEKLSEFMLKSI